MILCIETTQHCCNAIVELRIVTASIFPLKVLPVNAFCVKQNQCFLLDLADWVTYLNEKFIKFSIFSVHRQPTRVFFALRIQTCQ